MKNNRKILGVAAVVLAALLMVMAYVAFRPQTAAGAKALTIEVVGNNGASVV